MELDTAKDEEKPEEDFNAAMPTTVEIEPLIQEQQQMDEDELLLFEKYLRVTYLDILRFGDPHKIITKLRQSLKKVL
jgi:hypothetical protein